MSIPTRSTNYAGSIVSAIRASGHYLFQLVLRTTLGAIRVTGQYLFQPVL
jgi:hypothetical protein